MFEEQNTTEIPEDDFEEGKGIILYLIIRRLCYTCCVYISSY